jgi:hypothetical protein
MEETQLLSLVTKFVGHKKIKNVEVSERKTYLGNEVIKVEFEDGTSQEMPAERLNSSVTDEQSDETTLRALSVVEPLRKIQAICLDSELYLDDIKFLLNVSFQNWTNEMMEKINIKEINDILEKKNVGK